MKPILNIIQHTLIAHLKQVDDLPQQLAILPGNELSLVEKLPQAATLKALKLYVHPPFPVQTAPDLTVPTWEKLSLKCTLVQSWAQVQQGNFLDLAEKISFHISHQPFSTEDWEGCFIMDTHEPWHWHEIDNGLALEMHFVTSAFNPIQG